MQRAAILSYAASLAPPYFSTLSYKRHDLRKQCTELKSVFWFYLQLLFETFLILKRIQRYIVTNVNMSVCKVFVESCRILTKVEFSRQIFEKSSFIKSNQNPFFHANGRTERQMNTQKQTDITKLTVACKRAYKQNFRLYKFSNYYHFILSQLLHRWLISATVSNNCFSASTYEAKPDIECIDPKYTC